MPLIDDFFAAQQPSEGVESALRAYLDWQSSHILADFTPSGDDDVDLRTYLSQLRAQGASPADLDEQAGALRLFYGWAQSSGLITNNPFDEYIFTHPLPSDTERSPRPGHMTQDPEKYELESLRALDQITEELISAVDIQSALDSTLRTLLRVMNLQTGWVSMRTDSNLGFFKSENPPTHGFVPAAAQGLPPGLETDSRLFLSQPPLCRCQKLLIDGRLNRAVNIVECSRLEDARQANGDVQGLRYHATAPLILQGKPVGLINVAASNWDILSSEDLRFLTSVGTRVPAALERAQYYETSENQRQQMEKELKMAREIQQGLMRCEIPDIPGYQFACTWQPARQVAGDFYNIFPLKNSCWGVVIGDVADKGTAAALYMAMIQSLVMSEALRHPTADEILREVNRLILLQTSSLIFVSIFLAIIDPQTGRLEYANAGHNPPLLRRADGRLEALNNTGTVVGIFEDLQLSQGSAMLDQGEALLLYTDGLTETWRRQPVYEDYGDERLRAAVEAAPPQAEAILQHVLADLKAFSQDEGQDDLTILVISRD